MKESQYPMSDFLEEMGREDFVIVYDKVKIWKLLPKIVRGTLAAMALIVGTFFVINGIGWLDLAFVAGIFLMVALAMEWGIRTYTKRLKEDLLARQKRIVEGELAKRYYKKSGNNSSQNGMWVIGKEHFRMEPAEYNLASEGDLVRMELLPATKLIIRLMVLEKNGG